MRRGQHMLVIVLAMTALSLSAQERELTAAIEHVSVFFQGAQVERATSSVALPAGQSVLVVRGLERNMEENSLRVGIKGSGKILTVARTTDYLHQKSSSEQIESLRLRLEEIDRKIEDEQAKHRVFEQERNLLISNSKLGGSQSGVSVSQIKEAAIYYRLRLTEIEQLMLEVNRKVKALNEEKSKINRQLTELNYRKNQPTSTLNITVEMEKAGSCGLQLDYYIPDASWYPQYDIRIDEIGQPVNLVRKASVRQYSGEDWNDVMLTFSTGNPGERQVFPDLRPWYLDFIQPEVNRYLKGAAAGVASKSRSQKVQPQQVQYAEAAVEDDEFDYTPPPVERSSKHSILEFSLTNRGSIPSDNNEHGFSLGSEELGAKYHYQAVPKLDKAAYLVATIRDWEGYELVDGVANIYYEKTFIGETFLSTTMLLDSLQLSLGRDKGLIVDRKSVKDFTRTRSIGSNVRKTFAYEIQVRNTKQTAVDLILEDQVPVSANSQITVDVEDTGEGEFTESTGKLIWRMRLDPNETISVPIKYSVKYPEGMVVGL